MFTNLSLKVKFALIMVLIGFVANLSIAIVSYYYIEGFKKRELTHDAKIILLAEKSSRDYTSNILRPAVMNATKKFVMPAESATFVALGVAKIFKKFMPDYIYQEPTLSPLNLKNRADAFQKNIIYKFKNNPSIKSISGYHKFNGTSYFYVMKPVEAKKGCMICHGNPENKSPITQAIVKKYGTTHGWHWKVGTVIGSLSVLVPTRYIDAVAVKNIIIIIAAIFVLPFIALIIALFFINMAIIKPIHEMTELAESVSTGKSNEDFKVKGKDEIGKLAQSFNRLKKSYLKAVQLLSEKNKNK